MGKRRDPTDKNRSKTLPSSPSRSSSSSDFEFSVAASPRKSCPADELFYKGQLLPLHLPPRISMVRSLLLSSSSAPAAASRDSTASSSSGDSFSSDLSLLAAGIDVSCDSSRPSSVADDDSDFLAGKKSAPNKYFSLSRFSNAFKKDPKPAGSGRVPDQSGSTKTSSSPKEVIRKYLRKVKPFYEKLSQQKQQPQHNSATKTTSPPSYASNTALFCSKPRRTLAAAGVDEKIKAPSKGNSGNYSSKISQSFSGNLNYLRKTRRSCVASCPSSMRSSPTHPGSGIRSKSGFSGRVGIGTTSCGSYYADSSTMEELQSAIQGAIAHCKNSLR